MSPIEQKEESKGNEAQVYMIKATERRLRVNWQRSLMTSTSTSSPGPPQESRRSSTTKCELYLSDNRSFMTGRMGDYH